MIGDRASLVEDRIKVSSKSCSACSKDSWTSGEALAGASLLCVKKIKIEKKSGNK